MNRQLLLKLRNQLCQRATSTVVSYLIRSLALGSRLGRHFPAHSVLPAGAALMGRQPRAQRAQLLLVSGVLRLQAALGAAQLAVRVLELAALGARQMLRARQLLAPPRRLLLNRCQPLGQLACSLP